MRYSVDDNRLNSADTPRRFKSHHRIRRSCGGLLLVGILLLILFVLGVLAKTGIITIPYLSDWLYRVPTPTRTVTVDEDEAAAFAKGVSVDLNNGIGNITITEKELTYYIRSLAASGEDPLFAPTVQAAISPDGVEVFGLLLKPFKTNVTLVIVPVVLFNQVTFELKSVTLGTLPLPASVAQNLLREALKDPLAQLSGKVQELGEINQIILTDGALTVEGALKTP